MSGARTQREACPASSIELNTVRGQVGCSRGRSARGQVLADSVALVSQVARSGGAARAAWRGQGRISLIHAGIEGKARQCSLSGVFGHA
jgi:hypothetical protein